MPWAAAGQCSLAERRWSARAAAWWAAGAWKALANVDGRLDRTGALRPDPAPHGIAAQRIAALFLANF